MRELKKITAIVLAMAAMLAFAPGALADEKPKSKHEGPPPAAGEIIEINQEMIGIKEHDGKEHKFKIDAHTKYGTAKEAQKFEDLAKGDHVLITYHGEGDAAEALVIRELPAHGHGKVEDLKKKKKE